MKCLSQLLLAALCASLIFSACKKVQEAPKPTLSTSDSINPDALVPTPAGLMRLSHIHLIENGYTLMRQGGHMYKVERASRNIIEDFGAIQSDTSTSTPINTKVNRSIKTASGSGLPDVESIDVENSWVTDAEWQNTSSDLITSFSADWVVPNLPASNDNQLLYIFNGLANAPLGLDIMQPVLQWGNGPAGNTNGSWAVANWYVWIESGEEYGATTPLDAVSPNTALEGILTYTGQEGASAGAFEGSYNYTSTFTNLTTGQAFNNPLTIMGDEVADAGAVTTFIPQQTTAYETLETWTHFANGTYTNGVTQPSDYPANQSYVNFYNSTIIVNGTQVSAVWTPQTDNTQWGESTLPMGTTNRIYWHPEPKINNVSDVGIATTSTSYTVTGYPGSLVNFSMTAFAFEAGPRIVGTTTATFTSTTSGVIFSNGSSSISTTNGTVDFTVTMPSSGSFNAIGSYTTNVGPPSLLVHINAGVSVN